MCPTLRPRRPQPARWLGYPGVMGSGQSSAPAVRKHLMTPGQPRVQRPEPMSLGAVQRWVLSSLAATTIMHLAVGVMIAAYFSHRLDAKIGLLVISAAFGIGAMVAALLIHKLRLLPSWLLIGLLPAVVGAFLFCACPGQSPPFRSGAGDR